MTETVSDHPHGASFTEGGIADEADTLPRAQRRTAPIVPAQNVAGRALVSVIAIMTFLSCLTLGAVTLVRDTASMWESQISREATIQIKPGEGLDMEAALERAAEIASGFPGITGTRIVDREATARLLAPWLGSGLNIDELPVPRLVIVTINEDYPPNFARLRETITAEVPQASLDDHRTWVDRLVTMARTTVTIGIAALALMLTATVLSVVFATRGAMAGNRDIVQVLHFVGARDGYIAGQFQRRFLRLGLKGGVAGGLAATATFLIAELMVEQGVGSATVDQMDALFGRFQVGASAYAGVAAIVLLIAALTAITSRATVYRTLRAMR